MRTPDLGQAPGGPAPQTAGPARHVATSGAPTEDPRPLADGSLPPPLEGSRRPDTDPVPCLPVRPNRTLCEHGATEGDSTLTACQARVPARSRPRETWCGRSARVVSPTLRATTERLRRGAGDGRWARVASGTSPEPRLRRRGARGSGLPRRSCPLQRPLQGATPRGGPEARRVPPLKLDPRPTGASSPARPPSLIERASCSRQATARGNTPSLVSP